MMENGVDELVGSEGDMAFTPFYPFMLDIEMTDINHARENAEYSNQVCKYYDWFGE